MAETIRSDAESADTKANAPADGAFRILIPEELRRFFFEGQLAHLERKTRPIAPEHGLRVGRHVRGAFVYEESWAVAPRSSDTYERNMAGMITVAKGDALLMTLSYQAWSLDDRYGSIVSAFCCAMMRECKASLDQPGSFYGGRTSPHCEAPGLTLFNDVRVDKQRPQYWTGVQTIQRGLELVYRQTYQGLVFPAALSA